MNRLPESELMEDLMPSQLPLIPFTFRVAVPVKVALQPIFREVPFG
jgi:hypothetical protein